MNSLGSVRIGTCHTATEAPVLSSVCLLRIRTGKKKEKKRKKGGGGGGGGWEGCGWVKEQ